MATSRVTARNRMPMLTTKRRAQRCGPAILTRRLITPLPSALCRSRWGKHWHHLSQRLVPSRSLAVSRRVSIFFLICCSLLLSCHLLCFSFGIGRIYIKDSYFIVFTSGLMPRQRISLFGLFIPFRLIPFLCHLSLKVTRYHRS